MSIRRRQMMASNSKYKFVDYVCLNGSQYIETEWVAKGNPEISIEIERKNIATTSGMVSQLCRSLGGDTYCFNMNFGGDVSYFYRIFFWNVKTSSAAYQKDVQGLSRKTYKMSKTKGYVGSSSINLLTRPDSAVSSKIHFFCNGSKKPYNLSTLYVYGITCKNDGVVEMDLKPCIRKEDDVCGFLDIVNDVFYRSNGTSDFYIE